ncbi:hypothetical protein SLEP1_g4795 [Rubroshorea leprosula]|uniref:Reverse transcriptase domain-containing protein n=1 Tax=Rubroshorea leprosula TaxID=152421 RepID=A0AAV5HU50_9ROSI|nr:hypothetical protein SLEP1_g4795 [Rubroshorea leprosula]
MANSNVLSLTFHSPQEKDQLDQSVKRIKNVNLIATTPSKEEHMAEAATNPLSYRDKLTYDGSFESPNEDLSFDAILEYLDEELDIDDDPDDPTPIILFSKEEKRCMREPWKNALIVKTFGKTVHKDLSKVINGGPWFVGINYLTIRPWEPNFKPESATFSHTMVWAKVSGLSAEYYDTISLQRIGNEIETLLRVDAHTAHHTCGQYAHVPSATASVINVDLQNQANINEVSEINVTGCRKPEVLTSTERVGGIQVASNNHVSNYTADSRHIRENQFDEFGPWLIVERKKEENPETGVGIFIGRKKQWAQGPKRDSISTSFALKGKDIVGSSKTINEDFGTNGNVGQSNSPTKAIIPIETISSPMTGPFRPFTNASTNLEASLLTIKEMIKNLETTSNFTFASSNSSTLPKSSSEIRNERSSSSFANSSAQPQLESPTSQQQQCDFNGGSLRAVIVKGGKNTLVMEGEGSVQGLAQSSPNSQIHRSSSFSKLNASFEGRFDSYDGDDPCYHQALNLVGDGGDVSRMSDASVSLSGGHNDVVAQGNSGTDDAREVTAECGYPCSHVVDSDGSVGSLWLLWDDNEVCVDVITSTFQAIHAIVQVKNFGGAHISQSRVRAYTDCMSDCNLMDIGYTGGRIWSRTTFDNIFVKKWILNARLDGIHRSLSQNPSNFLTTLEKELTLEYEKVLKLEEDLWFMKSKSNWIVDGDRNSKFFHLSTIKHRNHNRIHCLQTSYEDWICDQQAIVDLIKNHFMHLFTSFLDCFYHDSFSNLGVGILESYDLSFLDNPLTNEEIHNALFGLKPFKALGPNGLHPSFFQKLWDSVRSILCSDIHNIFSSASIPAQWNECLITLIPKTKALETVQQFRLIGLCNTTYKIISKIIVNRMKLALDDLISPCQASFVPGRNGTDNVLILQELVHSFSKRKGQVGDMVVKLDLERPMIG